MSEATAGGAELRSYHGQPVLKRPVWTWEVPTYFFFGGLAGASSVLAVSAEARGNDVLAKRAWAAAFAGIAASPPLLISDLGRPERFLNMMRMFKVTSPMSVGSWVLVGAGGATTLAAADAWTGRFGLAGRLARPAAALFGLPLATYTAALVANTAVPVWHEAHRELPFVFGAGAAMSAGAAAVATTPVAFARPARRLALGAAVVELASSELMERRLGPLGEPYRDGNGGRFRRVSQACVLGGAALLAARGHSSRAASIAAGALLAAGAMTTRLSVYHAGLQSAADPKYVVGPQRARVPTSRP